jgi:hypothetical protein
MAAEDLTKIKLVFTGSVGAGKTTAIGTLSEVPVLSTEAKPSESEVARRKATTTVAMDYGEITLEDGQKVHLYGTPGQRRFDFMCHILCQGALGLIILIDNTHPDPLSELDYYLNLNANFLSDNMAVIGITHYDENDKPSIEDYCQCLHERGEFWPVMHADARKAEDMALLIDTLLASLEYG